MTANRNKLVLAMARACMDARDVAKAANMPASTFNGLICGRSVRPATLGKVARALNVDVEELIEKEGT